MIDVIKKAGFLSMADRARDELGSRLKLQENVIKFSNPFLRATLGGIADTDTILIGAETGLGKTQLASEIAEDISRGGKKVFVFALEAHSDEWERRRKFSILSDLVKADGGNVQDLDYQDWILGEDPHLSKYEGEITRTMRENEAYKNIYTFYKESDFGLEDFIKKFQVIDAEADLVIVDHLHYFDLFSPNKNEELEMIMKKLRQLTQTLGKPVILIAHLRKLQNGQERKLVPDVSDFHGSSEISKVCTRAIMLGAGKYIEDKATGVFGYETYIKAVKNRLGQSRTKLIGKILFDPTRDRYNEDFVQFGYEENNQFKHFDVFNPMPRWLERKLQK